MAAQLLGGDRGAGPKPSAPPQALGSLSGAPGWRLFQAGPAPAGGRCGKLCSQPEGTRDAGSQVQMWPGLPVCLLPVQVP